jgi:hypothetical protein
LREIHERPLIAGPENSLYPAAEFLTKNDLQKVGVRQNVGSIAADLNGNFNFQPTSNINVRLGYFGNYTRGTNWNSFHSLLNPENNALQTNYTIRTYLQMTQTFKTDDKNEDGTKKKVSNISNAYYTVRLSYERGYGEVMDENHMHNIFNYGYIGKFTTYDARNYARVIKGVNERPDSFLTDNGTIYLSDYYRHVGYRDTLFTFNQDPNINTVRGNFTRSVYDYYGQSVMRTAGNVRQVGGLINGDGPIGVYSNMWANVGTQQAGYAKSMNETFILNLESGFSIAPRSNPKAKHEILLGLNVEQQFRRNYSLGATNLWTLARLYANRQFSGLDSSLYSLSFDQNGVFSDTVNFKRKIVSSQQTNFDLNFRNSLIQRGALDPFGNKIDQFTNIDVNSYKLIINKED